MAKKERGGRISSTISATTAWRRQSHRCRPEATRRSGFDAVIWTQVKNSLARPNTPSAPCRPARQADSMARLLRGRAALAQAIDGWAV